LYHYASVGDGDALRARGHRVAMPGECVPLAPPTAMQAP
ncbi:MAG: MBL fold metallo-hydrolase, partial [Stenotrophomonas sp.]|nr:MBL fold metallo-hydrolase [Stenotrophomonas sp.]